MNKSAAITEKFELRFRGKLLGYFSEQELQEIRGAITGVSRVYEREEMGVEDILGLAANLFDVTVTAMKGKGRQHSVVQARHAAMVILHEQRRTLASVSEVFGGRTHGAAYHAIRSVQEWEETDKKFAARMEKLRKLTTEVANGRSETLGQGSVGPLAGDGLPDQSAGNTGPGRDAQRIIPPTETPTLEPAAANHGSKVQGRVG